MNSNLTNENCKEIKIQICNSENNQIYEPIIFLDDTLPYFLDPQLSTFKTYLNWSIFNTVCCVYTGALIWFCSIPSLIFSLKTQSHLQDRNIEKAVKYAHYSKVCNIIASVFAFLCVVSIFVCLGLYGYGIIIGEKTTSIPVTDVNEEARNQFQFVQHEEPKFGLNF